MLLCEQVVRTARLVYVCTTQCVLPGGVKLRTVGKIIEFKTHHSIVILGQLDYDEL